jgi:L-asparaginase
VPKSIKTAVSRPIVHIVTTGGTIASRVDAATGAAIPVLGGNELLAQVPGLFEIAEARVTEFGLIGSWNMTPQLMARLARTVAELVTDSGVTGVVVTHGTDTMEETAFALDVFLEQPAPVVLTGAMRNPTLPGPDGQRNLLHAVRTAVDPNAAGLGVLVVMNGEAHAAHHVTKVHTTALNAFASPGLGPVGLVDDDGFWLRRRPQRFARLPVAEPAANVYLIKMAAGMDDLLLRAALEAGTRGIVIEGAGTGNVYAGWEESISALLQAGVPVVLASRCLDGRVTPTYGGPGGAITLRDMGVIPAGDLSGPKARLALAFALGAGLDRDAIRAFFAAIGNGVAGTNESGC